MARPHNDTAIVLGLPRVSKTDVANAPKKWGERIQRSL